MSTQYNAFENATAIPPNRWKAVAPDSRSAQGEYALATGAAAVRRLLVLHNIYSPAGRRVLLQAGLKPGIRLPISVAALAPSPVCSPKWWAPRERFLESTRTRRSSNKRARFVRSEALPMCRF